MNASFFDTGYLSIINDRLIAKISHGTTLDKMQFWRLKDLIKNDNVVDVISINRKNFQLHLKKEEFFKCIVCETELFFNRAFIQLQDYQLACQNKTSASWMLVTLYYFLFFNICCLLRFLDRGYIYLSNEHVTNICNKYLAWTSTPMKIDSGNYFFKVDSYDDGYGNVIIDFSNVGTTHKVIWGELHLIISDLILLSSKEEKMVYTTIVDILNKFSREYPSVLRNDLNYNGETCLKDFDSLIFRSDIPIIDDKFYTKLLKIPVNNKNMSSQIESIAYIASYLYHLNEKLSCDFYERGTLGKKFVNLRDKYIKK